MSQSFIHESESENFYLYDDNHRLSMWVHPEFEKAFKTSKEVEPYYWGKYTYLKNHGFFAKSELANFETIIDESIVKESIIQTNQIIFEVTDFCNLSCTYCAYGELYKEFEARNLKNMKISNAVTLLKYLFTLSPQNNNRKLLISFYGGEPLLNMNFIKQIVKVANQLNIEKEINIFYSMTTNATLIHKHISFLVANKFRLLISLDGNEKNHSYRVFKENNKNSFRKVIENIDMIQRDYPEYFDSNVNFNAVLHNRNSVKEIFDFIFTRYQKIPRIAELSLNGVNSDKKELFEKMFQGKRESESKYQKEEFNLLPHDELLLYKELVNFLKFCSINYYIANITSLLLNNESKYVPTNTCLPFSKKIFLTTCNKLLPCERISHKYTMGIVKKNARIDIPRIAQQFSSYYEHLKKVCQYCYAYRYCGVCMFCNIHNLDKLDKEEFICNQFYDQKAFQNKLYRIFSFLEKYPNDFAQILENFIIE